MCIYCQLNFFYWIKNTTWYHVAIQILLCCIKSTVKFYLYTHFVTFNVDLLWHVQFQNYKENPWILLLRSAVWLQNMSEDLALLRTLACATMLCMDYRDRTCIVVILNIFTQSIGRHFPENYALMHVCVFLILLLCFCAFRRKWFLDKLGHSGLNRILADYPDKTAYNCLVIKIISRSLVSGKCVVMFEWNRYALCTFTYTAGPGHQPIVFEGRTEVCILKCVLLCVLFHTQLIFNFVLTGNNRASSRRK